MRDFDERKDWPKAPLLALLAAGLVTGGAWEIMANAEVPVPAAPEAVAEPSAPLTLEYQERLTAPAVEAVEPAGDLAAEPTFTPFTAAPSILNRNEVVRAMEAAYPAELRDNGLGGTVRVFFFIDATGAVQRTVIEETSGFESLDAAAMHVAAVYRFSPALNRDAPVPVWVSFPITFRVR